MKEIGKITVKHFLNQNLFQGSAILGGTNDNGEYDENLEPHPLYVKITFIRANTQIKSIIDDSFYSFKEAKLKHGPLLDVEIKMIQDIITREYLRLGSRFTLKGTRKKFEFYHQDLWDFFFESYLWKDFSASVMKSRTIYARLLLARFPKIPVTTYFKAAITLLKDSPAIQQFREKFETLELIEGLLRKTNNRTYIYIADWKYGQIKDQFGLIGLKKGLSFSQVSELIATIDNEIERGEK